MSEARSPSHLRACWCRPPRTRSPAPAPSSSAQPANAADLEAARTLYREGKALRAQGDLVGALSKLKAAHELGRTPITGLELARTYEMLHLLVEARATCLDVATIPVASDETERSVTARSESGDVRRAASPP